MINELKRTA